MRYEIQCFRFISRVQIIWLVLQYACESRFMTSIIMLCRTQISPSMYTIVCYVCLYIYDRLENKYEYTFWQLDNYIIITNALQINAWAHDIAQYFPDVASVSSIGKSYEGNDVLLLKVENISNICSRYHSSYFTYICYAC